MFFDKQDQKVILRVRLSPNSSSCSVKGVFTDAEGHDFLKINVVSVPEKGKANAELKNFLAKKLKLPKNKIEIISGETDRYKKILIRDNPENIVQLLLSLPEGV